MHAVLFTHEHADHLQGLDDLRLFQFYLGHGVPLYCEEVVEERIRRTFDYAFSDVEPTHAGAAPQLSMHSINADNDFDVLGKSIKPVRLKHGPRFDVLGFRIGNVAYCTDTSGIETPSREKLRDLDVLILDALRMRPHISHLSIEQAIEIAQDLKPKRMILTHMSHDVDYESVSRDLPDGVELAYDGMRIHLT